MNQLEMYYAAYRAYRELIAGNDACRKFGKQLAANRGREETISVYKTECHIEEDWIAAIEQGIEHIEKAIAQNRQFILREGEVEPIEKAKHVSRASVEHLAKHSNLITHEPEEEEELLPDSILVTENKTNFAIYENRFLYMVVCYARDFVDTRYRAITDVANKHKEQLALEKQILTKDRKMKCRIDLLSETAGGRAGAFDEDTNAKLERIEDVQSCINRFLGMDLMREVSRVPMLKPPVVRTNVLKMDNDFKGVFSLYGFLTQYDKPGYTVKESESRISPFAGATQEEFSETVALLAFLLHEHGNGLEETLEKAYLEEQKRRVKEQEAELLNRIAALREQIRNSGKSAEEYLLAVEERNRQLEDKNLQLDREIVKNERLQEQIRDLNEEIVGTQILLSQCEKEKIEIEENGRRMLEQCRADCAEKLQAADARLSEERQKTDELTAANQKMEAEIVVKQGRIHALLHQLGLNGGDEMRGEKNDGEWMQELEKEMYHLTALFGEEWREIRKRIRRQLLWDRVAEHWNALKARVRQGLAGLRTLFGKMTKKRGDTSEECRKERTEMPDEKDKSE